QVVYQLSDQRQNIVTISSPAQAPETDVAFELTRGVVLIQGPAARTASGQVPEAAAPPVATIKAPTLPTLAAAPEAVSPVAAPPVAVPTVAAAAPLRLTAPIRLAALDGKMNYFAGVAPKDVTVQAVQPTDNPDLIWDPVSHDVIAWGDVVAYG